MATTPKQVSNTLTTAAADTKNKKEINPVAEMCALVEIAEIIARTENTEAAQKESEEKIVRALEKYSKYEIDLDKPMPCLDNKTLQDYCELTRNTKASHRLILLGANLSARMAAALQKENPKVLEEIQTKLTSRKKLITEFKNELNALISSAQNSISLSKQKKAAEIQEKFQAFQKECEGLLVETNNNTTKMAILSKEYTSDLSILILNGKEKVEAIAAALREIVSKSSVETYATLSQLSHSSTDTTYKTYVCFYFVKINQLLDDYRFVKEKIAGLPKGLKDKAEKIVAVDKATLSQVLNHLNKTLEFCTQGFLKDYMRFIPKEMYTDIYTMFHKFKSSNLIQVNQRYLEAIKEKIAVSRKKFEDDLFPLLFDLLKDKLVVENRIQYKLKLFDSSIAKFLDLPKNTSPESFERFIAYHAMNTAIEEFIARYTPLASCLVTVLQQEKYKNEECRKIAIEILIEEGGERPIPHEEIHARDKKQLFDIEQARRQAIKDAELAKNHKSQSEQEKQKEVQKKKMDRDAVKEKVLAGMEMLSLDESNLLEDILQGTNLHLVIKETVFRRLAINLNLPLKNTHSSSGGGSITIYETVVNFHHNHKPDLKGTLDGGCIKTFKEALEKIGITSADLTQHSVHAGMRAKK